MSIQASHEVSINLDALSYARRVYEALDTPVSLSCYLLLRNKEFEQLARKSIDPSDYSGASEFQRDYQAVKLLSKYPFMDTGIDVRREAILKFIEAENQCFQTNDRFRRREIENQSFGDRVERVLSLASRKISHVLGPVPSLGRLDFSFGPGANYGVRGETSVFNKVTSALECTYAFADILQEFLEEFPGWLPPGSLQDVRLVSGNQLSFVEKDAKIMRPICIEPLLNGLYQKGIGSWIRKRLKSFGIDLFDQGTNQRLASQAMSLDLSTVDFSSASDTVSYLLVQDLLPFDWFQALDVARSPNFEFEGKWWTFQKFTSMGNAYTFELETLIFYSIACACCEELGISFETGVNLSVYGDDVIIPRGAYDLFSEVTKICGFTVNDAKSFRDGLFYESCGHDFFDSLPVRPYLIKQRLNKLLPAMYAANTIRRIQQRLSPRIGDPSVLDRFDRVHAWVVGRIPRSLRVLGPEGFGDGHLIAELDEAATSRPSRVSRDRLFEAWRFRTYVQQPIRRLPADGWPIAYALYFNGTTVQHEGVYTGRCMPDCREPLDNGGGYALRGKTRLSRVSILCHGQWRGFRTEYSIADWDVEYPDFPRSDTPDTHRMTRERAERE